MEYFYSRACSVLQNGIVLQLDTHSEDSRGGQALFPAGEPTGADGRVGAQAVLGTVEEGGGSPGHRRQGLASSLF
jgi:hypothetical protein